MVRLGLADDWRRLDERIEGLSREIEAMARQDTGCERLMSVPVIGPIIASAWWRRSAPATPSPNKFISQTSDIN
jgi:transposase